MWFFRAVWFVFGLIPGLLWLFGIVMARTAKDIRETIGNWLELIFRSLVFGCVNLFDEFFLATSGLAKMLKFVWLALSPLHSPWKTLRCLARHWQGTVKVSLLVTVAVLLFLGNLYFTYIPDWSRLETNKYESSYFYDNDGRVIDERCLYCRESLNLDEMGVFPEVAKALEDRRFDTRPFAFDIIGIIRALTADVKASVKDGRLVKNQGGSTISQQVAKNYFAREYLKKERETKKLSDGIKRKIAEVFYAWHLESHLPRNKILEIWLNNVYFDYGRYGIQSASKFYFRKNVWELDKGSAVDIVCLARMPGNSPFRNPKEFKALRNRALKQLYEDGGITYKQKIEYGKRPIPERSQKDKINQHFSQYVFLGLRDKFRVVDTGIRVHTTINSRLQSVAYEALHQTLEKMKTANPMLKQDLGGAAILVDAKTGAIRVWTQEPQFRENQYPLNQFQRQTGSTFKPYFYAKWLEDGGRLSCADEGNGPCQLNDSPSVGAHMGNGVLKFFVNFPYQGLPRYMGTIDAVVALTQSRNCATMSGVQMVINGVAMRVSKYEILEMAQRLGIDIVKRVEDKCKCHIPENFDSGTLNKLLFRGGVLEKNLPDDTKLKIARIVYALDKEPPLDPGLTVAIGSIEASPFELVRAMTGFNGNYVEPYSVKIISDAAGAIVFRQQQQNGKQIFPDNLQAQIIRGLRSTVELLHGTAQKARSLGVGLIAKTGTATNQDGDATDLWIKACTPSVCGVVWIGRKDKLPLKAENGENESGGKRALPVLMKILEEAYKDRPKDFYPEITDPAKPFVAPHPESAENDSK